MQSKLICFVKNVQNNLFCFQITEKAVIGYLSVVIGEVFLTTQMNFASRKVSVARLIAFSTS